MHQLGLKTIEKFEGEQVIKYNLYINNLMFGMAAGDDKSAKQNAAPAPLA